MSTAEPRHIVLFDGVCNLCTASVQFIIKRDPAARFVFAPLDSPAGQRLCAEHGLDAATLESIVLISDGRCRVRSDAALHIARQLSWPWPVLGACRIIPRPLRDVFYRVLARWRYRLFGRRQHCMVPSGSDGERFLTA